MLTRASGAAEAAKNTRWRSMNARWAGSMDGNCLAKGDDPPSGERVAELRQVAAQPLRSHGDVIAERQLLDGEPQGRSQSRQVGRERREAPGDRLPAGKRGAASGRAQPVPNASDQPPDVAVVRRDVLAGDVRDETLVAVGLAVEDQAALPALPAGTETLRPQEEAELQRHVEPWQPARRVRLRPRDVVDAEAAALDQTDDLLDADLTRVVNLEGATRVVPAVEHREDGRVEQRPVPVVERAVDEDAAIVGRRRPAVTRPQRPAVSCAPRRACAPPAGPRPP